MSNEHEIALREGHRNASTNDYFRARLHLLTPENVKLFEAGHKFGWEGAPADPYRADFEQAMVASNEAGYVGASPAQTINQLALEVKQLRDEVDRLQAEPRKPDDVDLLLRAVFELCEATEDAPEVEPTNEHQRGFDKGRRFEAKGIRRAVGDWFQATFCGRSLMGEPVIDAAPSVAEWKVGPLTDEVALILGRPNFGCIRYAQMLRELGQEIPRRAEAEQAAVIHWMLGFYATHGDKWAEAAVESMNARRAAVEAKP